MYLDHQGSNKEANPYQILQTISNVDKHFYTYIFECNIQ